MTQRIKLLKRIIKNCDERIRISNRKYKQGIKESNKETQRIALLDIQFHNDMKSKCLVEIELIDA